MPTPKSWHSRGYLPHCDVPGLLQFITFRLADSLPDEVLRRLMQDEIDDVGRYKQIEQFLDAGHGACWLKQPGVADIVEHALLHGDGARYRLLAWCVMPNHIHALIETIPHFPLFKIVQGWKSYTARLINQHLGRSGSVWMRDYFDRYIRDDHHLAAVIAYIHSNPVKAGLVSLDTGMVLFKRKTGNDYWSADVPVGFYLKSCRRGRRRSNQSSKNQYQACLP